MPESGLLSITGFADPVSSLTHLAGAAACAVLSVPLLRKGIRARHLDGAKPGVGHVAALAIFAFSAVLLLTMSGVYHLLGPGPGRNVLQRLDHAAIFVLIAGTFTPTHAILFRGPWRWGMLAFVWSAAIAGVTLKSVYFHATSETLGLVLYLAMGWLGIASFVLIYRKYGLRTLSPLALGGVAYTVGAVVEWANPRPLVPGVVRAHEVFHLAVLIGLALHWWFVWDTAGLKARARTLGTVIEEAGLKRRAARFGSPP